MPGMAMVLVSKLSGPVLFFYKREVFRLKKIELSTSYLSAYVLSA